MNANTPEPTSETTEKPTGAEKTTGSNKLSVEEWIEQYRLLKVEQFVVVGAFYGEDAEKKFTQNQAEKAVKEFLTREEETS